MIIYPHCPHCDEAEEAIPHEYPCEEPGCPGAVPVEAGVE